MNVTVVEYPGSSGVHDLVHALTQISELEVERVWHSEENIRATDLLLIAGGSSFGDYLRPGSLAKTSRISGELRRLAKEGVPMLGIGNGFQILCELKILPGILLPNANQHFLARDVFVRQETDTTPFTPKDKIGAVYRLPIACYFGHYFVDARTLVEMEESEQIVWRYCDEDGDVDEERPFNGCTKGIAGVSNRNHNVVGLMVHPERAVDAAFGSTDGRSILQAAL